MADSFPLPRLRHHTILSCRTIRTRPQLISIRDIILSTTAPRALFLDSLLPLVVQRTTPAHRLLGILLYFMASVILYHPMRHEKRRNIRKVRIPRRLVARSAEKHESGNVREVKTNISVTRFRSKFGAVLVPTSLGSYFPLSHPHVYCICVLPVPTFKSSSLLLLSHPRASRICRNVSSLTSTQQLFLSFLIILTLYFAQLLILPLPNVLPIHDISTASLDSFPLFAIV
jgi:hypothetical protein